MNANIYAVLLLLSAFAAIAHSEEEGFSSEDQRKAFHDLMKCSHANCPDESKAFHGLFKDQRLACDEMCNPSKADPMEMNDEDRGKVFKCMKTNNCMPSKEEMKKNWKSPEFQKLKECSDSKCAAEVAKMKSLKKGD